MHKAIIMGIVPYLSVYSVLLRVQRDFGDTYVIVTNYTNQFAWLVVTVFWAWVAWQRQPHAPRPPRVSAEPPGTW